MFKAGFFWFPLPRTRLVAQKSFRGNQNVSHGTGHIKFHLAHCTCISNERIVLFFLVINISTGWKRTPEIAPK